MMFSSLAGNHDVNTGRMAFELGSQCQEELQVHSFSLLKTQFRRENSNLHFALCTYTSQSYSHNVFAMEWSWCSHEAWDCDWFGDTYLTQKCWLQVEIVHSPIQLGALRGLQEKAPKSTLANSVVQYVGSSRVEQKVLRTQGLCCMCFVGLLLISSSSHWQLGYISVLPWHRIQPSFIHRDQIAAHWESSMMWTKVQ